MKRLLVDCDHVFDVLTRGPFPQGAADDEAVEHHLRACHDCRRLAEALRPAIELLHEAVADDEALDLPEYQGALACDLPARRRTNSPAMTNNLATGNDPHLSAAAPIAAARRPHAAPLAARHADRALAAVRWIAASLLLASAGALAGAMYAAPERGSTLTALSGSAILSGRTMEPGSAQHLAEGVPAAQSLLSLTALRLPLRCLPASHRPTTLAAASELTKEMSSGSRAALRCCTECHHAGTSVTRSARMLAVMQESCRVCHHS